jgi:orotate phosphoribosyltransferase
MIVKNTFNFKEEDIYVVGKRSGNPKRSFLFISKLLGKHLPVNPDVVKATGFLLSSLKYGFNNQSFVDCIKNGSKPDFTNHAKDNPLVIGFCETATGLGMSVAASIEGCTYQTTTREPLNDIKKILSFEEEHSHATTHGIYSDFVDFKDYTKVILVDDEITTGKSLLNLIKEINKFGSIKEFDVMTILDWRSDEQKQKFNDFAKENNVKISVFSLIEGIIDIQDNKNYQNEEILLNTKTQIANENLNALSRFTTRADYSNIAYFKSSGRFGVTYDDILKTEKECKITAEKLSKRNLPNKLLVVGHGENIYIPSRIASYLKDMGYDVEYRSTSISPIYCDGEIIKDVSTFMSRGKQYYFYNKSEAENDYDAVIFLPEITATTKLCENSRIFFV